MILQEFITINITSNNSVDLKNKGYDVPKKGNDLTIKVSDLSFGSNHKILVRCDYCNNERLISFKKYNYSLKSGYDNLFACSRKCCISKKINTTMIDYGVSNVFQLESVKTLSKQTCLELYEAENFAQSKYYVPLMLERYNVVNVFQLSNVKENIKKTIKSKYGEQYNYASQVPEIINKIINTKISKGLMIPRYSLTKWQIFKRLVVNKTNRIKQELLKNWNGYDYYDSEYIKDNFSLDCNDSNYPNIDHKISVYYGYRNGYTVSELSDISNLCITKRWINIKKGIQCSDQFIRQNIQDNDICITYINN